MIKDITTQVKCPRCKVRIPLTMQVYLEKPNGTGKATATIRLKSGFEVHECK